eukprot:5927801-Heterocapsa_arctica.AAC.1
MAIEMLMENIDMHKFEIMQLAGKWRSDTVARRARVTERGRPYLGRNIAWRRRPPRSPRRPRRSRTHPRIRNPGSRRERSRSAKPMPCST